MRAQSEYTEWRSCSCKIAYPSLKDAQRAIGSMWRARRNGRDLRGLRAYRCRFCRAYHVGHASQEKTA